MSNSKRSAVWNYFKLINKTGVKSTQCIKCKQITKYVGNTTNMKKHLRIHHPILFYNLEKTVGENMIPSLASSNTDDPEFMQLGELEIDSISNHENESFTIETNSTADIDLPPRPSSSTSISTTSMISQTYSEREHPKIKLQSTLDFMKPMPKKMEDKYTNSLTYFIATEMMPYSIVEKPGFKYFVNNLQPQYKLPSRKTIATVKIPTLYKGTKEKIKYYLQNIQNMSFTTDCWTSAAMESYISLTCHFIDVDWNLNNFTLICQKLNEDHTAENIKNCLLSTLESWNININKVVCCTTDCGANILLAVSKLNWQHISCFGHVINTAVNKALNCETFKELITKAKKIQSSIAHSYKMTRDLKLIQIRLNKPQNKIPSSSPTRWWSVLKLLETIVEQQTVINTLFAENSSSKYVNLILSNQDISILDILVKMLKKFEMLSEHMSGDSYVTASALIPILKTINSDTEIDQNNLPFDNENLKESFLNVRETIIKTLNDRYEKDANNKLFLLITTYLDPRFRAEFLTDTERQIVLEHFNTSYNNLITDAIQIPQQPEKLSGLAAVLSNSKFKKDNIQNLSSQEIFDLEILKYEKMPSIDTNSSALQWWQNEAKYFPTLAQLANKYLCAQGTSVASERVFSCGGNIVNDLRTSLTGEHVEQLIFLAMNKKIVPK